jgi:hypothetical protein
MSETYQRKEVKSVSSAVLPVAVGGIVLAAKLSYKVLSSLSSAAREVYTRKTVDTPAGRHRAIKSLPAIRTEQTVIRKGERLKDNVDAIKVSVLLSVKQAGYIVENSCTLHEKLEALRKSSTESEAKSASEDLIKALETSHKRVFVKGLTVACKNASIEAGFPTVQTSESSGLVRVVATDAAGRALVTEISSKGADGPEITTEVVGISDGSCRNIMDAFDRALRRQGVESSEPRRKFTGGVCETEAARKFVQSMIRRQNKPCQQTERDKKRSLRRTQRLNQKNYLRTR